MSSCYCYSVWLRHLCMLHEHGLPTDFETVAELGPGDSLGAGLAALLCGAERYIALDAVRYADRATNLRVFDELVELFRNRAPIPDQREFPRVQPPLRSYAFPSDLLTPARLEAALSPDRVGRIRAALAALGTDRRDGPICYHAPWTADMIDDASVDLVFSQGVLQFVEDIPAAYAAMARWLRPDGVMSHEVTFQSIGITTEWNGHWACSEPLWKLAVGNRRHATNRVPHSAYVSLLQDMGWRILTEVRVERSSGIDRSQLACPYRHLSDRDLSTSSSLLQSMRQTASPPQFARAAVAKAT
ncbi:methyltransferase domain-containing protein [Alsobacter soli]|uniref:methyltransferase domain-containing protein n=1 Tax=Alsobacter soli TaxID=2109933 RepID=UPI0013048418|nr:methyltransferase domain-containing protein [Alsobacter soli]